MGEGWMDRWSSVVGNIYIYVDRMGWEIKGRLRRVLTTALGEGFRAVRGSSGEVVLVID